MTKTELKILEKKNEAKKTLNQLFLRQMGIQDDTNLSIAAVDNFVDLIVETAYLQVVAEMRKNP